MYVECIQTCVKSRAVATDMFNIKSVEISSTQATPLTGCEHTKLHRHHKRFFNLPSDDGAMRRRCDVSNIRRSPAHRCV